MVDLKKFEPVATLQDLELLRPLALEAAELAKQATAERDEWKRRYDLLSEDIVSIPEVTLDQLAQMVRPKE